MRLSISNIAWDVAEDAAVAALLARHGVDAIDIAPAKYFTEPGRVPEAAIVQVRRWWAGHGVEITGMQALLFGTAGLNMFGDAGVRAAMLVHFGAMCRIGALLGAPRLVFGSPRNRDRAGLDDLQARDMAIEFFARLAQIAQSHGVLICLEPNPPRYGCNFMTDSAETAAIVEAVGHQAIRMQLDTGALAINAEDVGAVLEAVAELVGHVHASEPDLVPLGDGSTDHAGMAAAISRALPGHVVAVEMVATRSEPHLASLERALRTACLFYGNRAARM